MKSFEVWQRLRRPCIHRDEKKCTDSGSKTKKCLFGSCPFLNESYDWKKFDKEVIK